MPKSMSFNVMSTTCIIPAFNARPTISRALHSVIQTPGIREVIVVDDGSDDGTDDEISIFSKNCPTPITFIQQSNAGAGAARNTGIKAASLDWIAFLDADDEMLPTSISAKAAHLAACPTPDSVDAVHGGFIRGDTGMPFAFATTLDNANRDSIGRPGGIPGGVVSYVFRRNALVRSGGFREGLNTYEDFDLILRLLANGNRIVGNAEPGFIRHYTPESLSRKSGVRCRLHNERLFLRIAATEGLLSRREVQRRLAYNTLRSLYYHLLRR